MSLACPTSAPLSARQTAQDEARISYSTGKPFGTVVRVFVQSLVVKIQPMRDMHLLCHTKNLQRTSGKPIYLVWCWAAISLAHQPLTLCERCHWEALKPFLVNNFFANLSLVDTMSFTHVLSEDPSSPDAGGAARSATRQ